ncbi:hypothetical protein AVEN_27586-1 [Araneus ventricosus]|uniref:Uncharacterized protein n=1 Tax=Araneus ventricosus TaxID=182803 RepID=A0A4Y2UDH6_ARAVE|nr:hypothetical protein AVEN_27586-1 [Araneus ventricosus]
MFLKPLLHNYHSEAEVISNIGFCNSSGVWLSILPRSVGLGPVHTGRFVSLKLMGLEDTSKIPYFIIDLDQQVANDTPGKGSINKHLFHILTRYIVQNELVK